MTRKTLLPDIIGLMVPSIGLSCVVILQMHSTVREITQAFEMRFYQRVMKNFYKEHVTEYVHRRIQVDDEFLPWTKDGNRRGLPLSQSLFV